MMGELGELAGIAGAGVVVALVELVKRLAPGLEDRWYPLVALAAGIAVNLAVRPWSGVTIWAAVVTGIVVGLAASGLYSGGKAVVGR